MPESVPVLARLGAVVTGYDIRPETQDQVESVGARFLRLDSDTSVAGEGGYARALTAGEQFAQQAELAAQIARFDVVITTAQVPGRRPPLARSPSRGECHASTMPPSRVGRAGSAGPNGRDFGHCDARWP